jgi:hypothetical protein
MLRRMMLALAAIAPLLAQLDRGSLTGTVADSSGAVIPKVQIVVRNVATGASYTAQSNASGLYTAANLPPARYEMTFESQGFKKLVRENITLGATEVLRIDAVLAVGSVTESVEVTAEVPRLQTETPEVGTSLDNNQLLDLPLSFSNARLAENFAYAITPGVSGDSYNSHINGSSSFSKETLLDGASITVYRSGDFGQMATSVEALQEFKVQTSGMSAEYGRTQAGVFNFVMKSGTNKIHGSVYGGLRNEALNANTFVNKARGVQRSVERKQNYAFSFGGPVYVPKVYNGKNRTFFYATYERWRQRIAGFRAPDRAVPVPEFYDGDFSRLLGAATGQTDALGNPVYRGAIYDPATFRQVPNSTRWMGDIFPGNRIPVARFSQVSQRLNAIAKEHYLPTVRDASGKSPLTANTTFPVSSTPIFDQHQFSIKGDQVLSAAQKLSGSYSYNSRPRLLLDQGGMWDVTDPEGGPLSKARTQQLHSNLARVAHDWTLSPTMLNHAGLFVNRLSNPNNTVHTDIDGGKLLGIKNFTTIGMPNINWGGGPFVTLQNPGDPQFSTLNSLSWGLQDTLSWSRGRHFIKFGFDVRGNSLNSRSGPGGTFAFNATATAIPNEAFSGNQTGYSFASYLLGIVNNSALSDPVGLGGRRSYYAGFVQDDFKVNRRLTLNLGLRWEIQPPTVEVHDRMSNFSFTKIDPISGLPGATEWAGDCSACSGKRAFGRKDWTGFGPRIGVAWRPFDKWVIRTAYGIMYEADTFNGLSGVIPGGLGGAYGGTYSLGADPLTPWRGIFNWDEGFPASRYTPPRFDVSYANRNQTYGTDPEYGRNAYVQAWNFNIQRQLPGRVVLDIGYVGRKGTAMREGSLAKVNQIPASALARYGRNLNNVVRNAADAAANGIAYPYPGFVGTVASALRPFPQLFGNTTVGEYGSPVGFSTYHALQVTVNRQYGKGLTVYANYVWSKSLTNLDASDPLVNNGRPIDYYNLKLEKAVAEYDIPHMFKGTVSYQLPVGRGRRLWSSAPRAVNTVLGGWSISAVTNYFSGTPLGFAGSFPLANGWNGAVNRANLAPGVLKSESFDKANFSLANTNGASNTYLNKSRFSDPAPLTLGNAPFRVTSVRNFGTINEDIGVQKNHKIGEKVRFQLRAELLNAFNRHNLGGITTNVTSPSFGQVTTVSGNRTAQLGTRLDF